MKIKLDENLPVSLVAFLNEVGHDADSVRAEGLTGQPDEPVWEAAQKDERFFITQDLDFSDLRRFAPGMHYGVLLIRLHNPTRQLLDERIRTLFQTEAVETWSRCFVVATDLKIRIRRPAASDV